MGLFDRVKKNNININQADTENPISVWLDCAGFSKEFLTVEFDRNMLIITGQREIPEYKTIFFKKELEIDRNYYDIEKTEVMVKDGLMRIFIPLNQGVRGKVAIK